MQLLLGGLRSFEVNYSSQLVDIAATGSQREPLSFSINFGVVVLEPRHSNDGVVAAQRQFDEVDAIRVRFDDEVGFGHQRSGLLLTTVRQEHDVWCG